MDIDEKTNEYEGWEKKKHSRDLIKFIIVHYIMSGTGIKCGVSGQKKSTR